MSSKPKTVSSEKKKTRSAETRIEPSSHALTKKIQTAEGWKRAVLRDARKRKAS